MSRSITTGMMVVRSSVAGGLNGSVREIDSFGREVGRREVAEYPWLDVVFGKPREFTYDGLRDSLVCVALAKVDSDVLQFAEIAAKQANPVRIELKTDQLSCEKRGFGDRLKWHYDGNVTMYPSGSQGERSENILTRKAIFANLHLMPTRHNNAAYTWRPDNPTITIFSR